MTEDLRVKLIVDTTQAKASISGIKKQVSKVGDDSKKAVKGSDEYKKNLDGIKETLASIKTLNVVEALRGAFNDFDLKRFAGSLKNVKNEFKQTRDFLSLGFQHIFGGKDAREAGLGLFDFDSAKVSIKEAKSSFVNAIQHIKNAFDQVHETVKKVFHGPVGIIASIILAIGALVKMKNNALAVAAAMRKITTEAAKIGMSVASYQKWAFIMEQVGSEADNLKDFIKTLSSEQVKLREGNQETIASFEKLGISVEAAANMSQEELFEETVAALSRIENQVERTATAYKIFGEEDAANLNNILSINNAELEQLTHNFEILGGYSSETLINRSTELTGTVSNLKIAWQGIKNVLAETVIPVVDWVAGKIVWITGVIRIFLATILNTDTSKSTKGMNVASKAVGSYGSAIKDTTKAIEELKRITLGFDELNIVSAPKATGAGSGSADVGYAGGAAMPSLGSVLPTAEDLGLDGFRAFMEEYGYIIEDVLAISLTGIGGVMAVLSLLHGNLLGAAKWLGIAGLGVAIGLGEGGTWDRLGKAIKDSLSSLWAWVKTNVLVVFTKEFWLPKWEALTNAWHESLELLKGVVKEKWNSAKEWFAANVKPVFTKEFWKNLWNNIKEAWNTKVSEIKDNLSSKWNSVKEWFNSNVKPVFTKAFWIEKWDIIKLNTNLKLDEIRQAIKNKWTSIKNWFGDNVKPIFTATYWKNKFNTIKDGAKSAFNGLIEIVERAINRIIRKINTLSWDVPSWVPGLGGQHWGFDFNEIYIPRLATGGIATRSTIANIGENGREAILPLENNTGWMDLLADKIASRNSSPSKIILNIDGKELGWATINNINDITRQTGGIQLTL